jgi:XTP/dITP diphosphohydrolase
LTEDILATVYFASSSRNKYNDYKFLLGTFADLQWANLHLDEPQTTDLNILVRRKLRSARQFLPYTDFFIEQTGLIVDAWQPLPGTTTGMFMDAVGNEGICKMLHGYEEKERKATAVTHLAYRSPDGSVQVFKGVVKGHIASEPRGAGGFGWDAIFIPEGQKKTFAEIDEALKSEYSTRMLASTAFYKTVLQGPNAGEVAQNRTQFLQLITDSFSIDEMNDLIFGLGVDPEEIPGQAKKDKARELILYFSRRRQITHLIAACRENRKQITWPKFA